MYYVIQARIQMAENKLQEASKSIQGALKVPGVRKMGKYINVDVCSYY